MLTAIRASDEVQVVAQEVERGKKSYRCPECKSEVVLKKCRLKVDHFAHKAPVACTYGAGESDEHRHSKLEIYEALQSHDEHGEVTKLQLERGGLETIRPDISFKFGSSYIAFEVQLSALTVEKIIQRTEEYAKKKITLLWLAQWSDRLLESTYAPSAWENWVHTAYYGRVYYWKSGLTVVPCHFGECYLWQTYSEWYSPEGEHQDVGGYWKRSKRFVVPVLGPKMNLLTDFEDISRPERRHGDFPIPAHRIWNDRHIHSWPEIPKPVKWPANSSKAAKAIDGEIIAASDEDLTDD